MRRDLEKYLVSLQKQYDEMNKALEEANNLLKEEKIDPAVLENITTYFNTINSNYQRVLYCRYLVKLPPKFIQKLQQKKLDKATKKFMEEQADQETVINEGQEALEKIEEVVPLPEGAEDE